jgi:hypothetical protein
MKPFASKKKNYLWNQYIYLTLKYKIENGDLLIPDIFTNSFIFSGSYSTNLYKIIGQLLVDLVVIDTEFSREPKFNPGIYF